MDVPGLRSALSTKAIVGAIPDVSGFINSVTNMSGNNLITLSKTGQSLGITYQNIVDVGTTQTITGQKTFTAQTFVQSNSLYGNIQLSPASGKNETGIGLFCNSDRSMVVDGDLWLISQGSFAQSRRFAILSRGNTSATARLTITTGGVVNIPGSPTLPTLTLHGPDVVTTVSGTQYNLPT